MDSICLNWHLTDLFFLSSCAAVRKHPTVPCDREAIVTLVRFEIDSHPVIVVRSLTRSPKIPSYVLRECVNRATIPLTEDCQRFKRFSG